MGRPPKQRRPPIVKHPAVIDTDIAPPPHLDEAAHQYWHEAIGHLLSMGVLSAVDLGTIERYAMLRSQVAEYHRMELTHGRFHITKGKDADGNEVITKAVMYPWAVQLKQLSPLLLRIESEWGFTPATRQAVTRDINASEEDSLEGFIAGAGREKWA
jgi:phage terminase small subunit